ncbi:MAG: capsule assembly Wzi family protein [Candidatus Acidiferrales bacterium]
MADPIFSANDPRNVLGPSLLKNIAEDQEAIWTSPAHLRLSDADWLVPLGAATGILLATDTEFSKHLSNSPSTLNRSDNISNYGLGALVGAGAGLYLWGKLTHEEHKRETGVLAGEAAIDSLAVTYVTQYAFGRERPLQDDYRGQFWQGGLSFPSEHSAAAWSIAGVIAHEYPGPLTSTLAYGLASAISSSRVTAKQHFPSDVLVGSAIGWLVAQEVYRHHHDPELGGGAWPTYADVHQFVAGRSPGSVGSPYVELDSWIYPAIERLAAMGYIHSDYLGMRPWTRLECLRLVQQAGERIRAEVAVPKGAEELYSALSDEFHSDLERMNGTSETSARIESIYTRTVGISGPPLNDSYHFGQTIINDYGRPYQEGFNTYDGFSGYGTAGRFTLYVRGEYQQSPYAQPYSLQAREAIANADVNPLQPATPFAAVDQFQLLDTYVASNYDGWDFAFGKQSLWWGPGDGTSLIYSDNAAPIYMFRGSRISPFRIPVLSDVLGPFKFDFFVGKLSGNEFPPRPVIHGENVSFMPTRNLQVGFDRLVEFGGVGRPLTAGAIWNSYASVKSSVNYRDSRNPGKRTSGFYFSYRPPLVRNWVSVYGEALGADEVTPLANPPRAAWNSGIYLPRIPGLPRLDFRAEGGYTDADTSRSQNGNFVYWDLYYHDLSTNKANLIGSWIGREGKGYTAWTTYHFNARNSFQLGFRHANVAKDFIPAGEAITDGYANVSWWLPGGVNVSGGLQYEKWLAPVLAPSPRTDWTASFQLAFYPHWNW